MSDKTKGQHSTAGLGYGILAYLIWGFFPVYFKALSIIPALQVVSHRIVWSVMFLSLILGFSGRWNVISEAFRDRRVVVLLITSALLIATNWLVFIIAIAHSQVIQSSLGYFITPFISVLLGVFFSKRTPEPTSDNQPFSCSCRGYTADGSLRPFPMGVADTCCHVWFLRSVS